MPDTRPLTLRQQEALDFIRAYIAANSGSPSFKEIRDGIGAALSDAHRLVKLLVKKGWISRGEGRARSIQLTEVCPHCGRGEGSAAVGEVTQMEKSV